MRQKSRKPRSEPVSGDEGEPKKRRREIIRQEEGSPMFSEDDGDEKPVKKVCGTLKLVWPFCSTALLYAASI